MPKFKINGKFISVSFLMEKILDISRHTEHLAREKQQNYKPDRPITREEVNEALRKMKSGKAIGSDSIPVEI